MDFGADDDEEEEEEDSKQEVEEETEEDSIQDNGSTMTLTPKLMIAMKKAAFETKSIRALAKFVQAFRCACHVGAIESDPEKRKSDVSFSDQEQCCVQRHGLSALQNMHSCCVIILITTQEQGTTAEQTSLGSYATIVSSFCGNLLHFVSQLMDREMQLFVLQSMKPYMKFYASLTKLHRKTVKVCSRFGQDLLHEC